MQVDALGTTGIRTQLTAHRSRCGASYFLALSLGVRKIEVASLLFVVLTLPTDQCRNDTVGLQSQRVWQSRPIPCRWPPAVSHTYPIYSDVAKSVSHEGPTCHDGFF